jgi:hypothetical protein
MQISLGYGKTVAFRKSLLITGSCGFRMAYRLIWLNAVLAARHAADAVVPNVSAYRKSSRHLAIQRLRPASILW